MKHRPLPITVTPVPEELLSGWLSRLAASNHCEVGDLLVHIGIDAKYAAALDFDLDMLVADRISVAARFDPAFVSSMTFVAIPEAEMWLTAQVPFQACPNCADGGVALRHWRKGLGVRLSDVWCPASSKGRQEKWRSFLRKAG